MAEEFAREPIDMLVQNRGILDDIISDCDTPNMSDYWGYLTAELEIKYHHSHGYHLATDNHTENFNTVGERYTKVYVAQYRKMWDRLLPFAEFTDTQTYPRYSRLLRFGPMWDSCQGCCLICCYGLKIPRESRKFVWKQTNLGNRWCHISPCSQSSWRKRRPQWFWMLISLTARTISN